MAQLEQEQQNGSLTGLLKSYAEQLDYSWRDSQAVRHPDLVGGLSAYI